MFNLGRIDKHFVLERMIPVMVKEGLIYKTQEKEGEYKSNHLNFLVKSSESKTPSHEKVRILKIQIEDLEDLVENHQGCELTLLDLAFTLDSKGYKNFLKRILAAYSYAEKRSRLSKGKRNLKIIETHTLIFSRKAPPRRRIKKPGTKYQKL
jgi:rubrerythrin